MPVVPTLPQCSEHPARPFSSLCHCIYCFFRQESLSRAVATLLGPVQRASSLRCSPFPQAFPCTSSALHTCLAPQASWLVFVVVDSFLFYFPQEIMASLIAEAILSVLFTSINTPKIGMESNYLITALENRKESQQNNHQSWQTLLTT